MYPKAFFVAISIVVGVAVVAPAQAVDFQRDVLPIFQANCFKCHGEEKTRGDLRLDSPAAFVRDGMPAVFAPGDPDDSLMIELITLPEDDDDRMPSKGDPLTVEQIATIKAWIAEGGTFGDWAGVVAGPKTLPARTMPAEVQVALAQTAAPVVFNRDVRPILSDNCFKCHGSDSNKRKADLRFDVEESMRRDRGGFAAVQQGDIQASALVAHILATDDDDRMPPMDSGKSLSPSEKAMLIRWIEEGAAFKEHWSYIPPTRPASPDVRNAAWVKNPIDRFVLARLEAAGLEPSPEAKPYILHRRVSFDVTGLPPDPKSVARFAKSKRGAAYEKLVDRLIASDHYGERMAIDWLDLVRYADTNGYHSDDARDTWPYRDFVINAFNENMPFDQFTVEQLAGDLLPNATVEDKIASGYNRLNQITSEGGAQPGEYIIKYAADRVRTTATTWLGMTMGCAECHDHKFDPITQKDFYSFSAYFADIKEVGKYSHGNDNYAPFLEIVTPDTKKELKAIDHELEKLRKKSQNKNVSKAIFSEISDLEKEKREIRSDLPTSLVTVSVKPRTVRVLPRGNWMDESGEIVAPAVPAVLSKYGFTGESGSRKELAYWLISKDNPLTARVFVNRLWKHFFGTGLSKVMDDLGSQGEWPSHPELLDWLAVEFIDSGWDMKHIVRLIVTSNTYKQSSMPRPDAYENDSFNRLLARQNRYRMTAELVRDNALSISGLLNERVGGPSAYPYQPEGYYADTYERVGEPHVYHADIDDNQYRRGVYTFWRRSFLHPSMLAFDAPTREECTAERVLSNTPLQALTLLNDPTYLEAARVFAENIMQNGGDDPQKRIDYASWKALSRPPSSNETDVLLGLYEKHRVKYANDTAGAEALLSIGLAETPDTLDKTDWAAWTSVARVLLNLHETITRM
jgi:Protein of unknown function (DUF1553)/Protein of unknown function (DUF1549)/Planctomycete cytochrome C